MNAIPVGGREGECRVKTMMTMILDNSRGGGRGAEGTSQGGCANDDPRKLSRGSRKRDSSASAQDEINSTTAAAATVTTTKPATSKSSQHKASKTSSSEAFEAKLAEQQQDKMMDSSGGQQQSGGSSSLYRKQNHCEIEKRRRDKMNNYIMELASVIPSFNHHSSSQQSKLDKLTVLRMAVQHVKSLRSSLCSFSSFHLRPSFLSSGNLLKNLILQMASHEAQDNLFMVVSCDRGKVLFMSQSSKDILNQDQSELTGQCLFDLLHKDDVSKVKEQISHLSLMPREMLIDSRTFQPIKNNQRHSYNQIHNQSHHQASSTPQPGARRSFFCRMRSGRDSSSSSSNSDRCSSVDKTMTSSGSSPSNQSSPSSSVSQNNRASHTVAAGPHLTSGATSGSRCQISPPSTSREQQRQQRQSTRAGSGEAKLESLNPLLELASGKIRGRSSSSSADPIATNQQQATANDDEMATDGLSSANPNIAADDCLRTLAAAVATTTTTTTTTTSEKSANIPPSLVIQRELTGGESTEARAARGCQSAATTEEHRASELTISDGSNSDCSGNSGSSGRGRDSGISGSQNSISDVSPSHRINCLNSQKPDRGTKAHMGGHAGSGGAANSRKPLRYTVMHCTGYLKTITLESDEMDDYDDEYEDYNSDEGGSSENEYAAAGSQRVRGKTVTCLVAICRRSPIDREFEPDKPLTFTCRYSIEGKFVFVDQRTTIALGYTPQQLLGTSHYAYCHKDSVNTFKECHRQSILRSEPVSSDIYQFRRANGKHVWLQTSLKSFRNPWTKFIDYIVASHTTAESSDAHYNEGCVPTKFNRDMTGEGSQSPSPASSSSSPASSSSLSLPSVEESKKSSASPSSSSMGSSHSVDSFASGGSIQALLKRIDRIKSGGIKHHTLDITSRKRADSHHHHHHHASRSSSSGSARKSNEDSGNYSDPQLCSSSLSSHNSSAQLSSDDSPTSVSCQATATATATATAAAPTTGNNSGCAPATAPAPAACSSSGNFIPDHNHTCLGERAPDRETDGFYLHKQASAEYRAQSFSDTIEASSAAAAENQCGHDINSRQNYDHRQQQQNRCADMNSSARESANNSKSVNNLNSRGASKSARPCLSNSRQHQRQSGANNHYQQHKNNRGGSLSSSPAWTSPSGSCYSSSAGSQGGDKSAASSFSTSSGAAHQRQLVHPADRQQQQQRSHHQSQVQQLEMEQQQPYEKMTRQPGHYVMQPVESVQCQMVACNSSYAPVQADLQIMPAVQTSGYINQQEYAVDMNHQQQQQMQMMDQSMASMGQEQQQARQQQQQQFMRQQQQGNMIPMVWNNCDYQSLPQAHTSHDPQQQQQDTGSACATQGMQSFGGQVTMMNVSDQQQMIEQQSVGCHQCANHICYSQQQIQQQHQQHLMVPHQQQHNHNTDLNNIDFTSLVVNGDLDEDQILECLAEGYDEPFYRIQHQQNQQQHHHHHQQQQNTTASNTFSQHYSQYR